MRASAAAAAFVLLLAGAFVHVFARPLDARMLDAMFAFNRKMVTPAVATDVLVVGIDDAFVDSVDEPLTLAHHQLATFLRSASSAGARVIALDIVLPDKRFDQLYSSNHPDADFHRSLLAGLIEARQHSTVVLAKAWDHDRHRYMRPQLDFVAVAGEGALASALVCADPDQRVRIYPDLVCQPDGTSVTLSSAVAAAVGKQTPWRGLINYQIGAPFQYLPIQDVLALARDGDNAALERLFSGRVVLLGSVQADVDLVDLPVPLAGWLPQAHRVPGVLLHAQIVRSMLNQGLIAPAAAWLNVVGVLLACLFWCRPGIVTKLALLLAVSLLLLLATHAMLHHGTWYAPASVLIAAWTTALGRSAWQAWGHFRDKQRLTRTFSGYVSPAVLGQILIGAIDARQAGLTLPVCVMFTDIRGFTTLSEHLSAEQVVALLNRYFARMTRAVHDHGGTVDKFIGDGMMTFFGAPNGLDSPARAALDAAHSMLDELALLNTELVAEGRAPLAIGIGIHCGPAVIGHIGSVERHEYTAIGDTVNIASRLEGLCAPLGHPIICSAEVAAQLGEGVALISLGERIIKGHSKIPVFGAIHRAP